MNINLLVKSKESCRLIIDVNVPISLIGIQRE